MVESWEMSTDLDGNALSQERVDLDWLCNDLGRSLSNHPNVLFFSICWHI